MPSATPDDRSIATLRSLSLDQIQAAQSGHAGLPLGAAPILHTLYSRFLVSDPDDPGWINRDRFVMSAGHGSALLYATLHLAGFAVGIDDLRAFRQWKSITPGHPETHVTPGVDATTGPLGQGISNAVGMAIAETMAAARLNSPDHTIIDHRTYALVSDGDLMEGVALEATALAGLLKLGKLIAFYDDNDVVIDGRASATHDADAVCGALRAYGWHVSEPIDGNDVAGLEAATNAAVAETERPSLIRVRTTIGFGSPRADEPSIHSGAVTAAEATATKEFLGAEFSEPFRVPDDVRAGWAAFRHRGATAHRQWTDRIDSVRSTDPQALGLFDRLIDPAPLDLEALRADVALIDGAEAARMTSGRIMAKLAELHPELVGGAADLAAATMAYLADGGDYSVENRAGRNIRFGVREHAMGAIANGIALHGIFRPFASTFLVFASYQANALRMAALEELPVLHVFSHDSITVGEDGPTHQPIEMLSMLRATPNTLVLRPGDAEETIASWAIALANSTGPSVLVLSRIALPPLDRRFAIGDASRGGYAVSAGGETPELVLVASGSEVSVAVDAAALLRQRGIVARVVSMPSQELFLEQPESYRDEVLPPGAPRLVIEAASPLSLWRIAGPHGEVYGIARFGASAPPAAMLENYGFTPEHVAAAAQRLVGAPVP